MNVVEFAERIARDLHDGPLQDVFATRLRLDTLVSRVPPDIQAEILQLFELQGRIIHRMRELGRAEAGSRSLSLSEALGTTVSDASIALGFAPRCSIDPKVDTITDDALANDIIHAVRDDGIGIPPAGRRGNGLVNLRTRAKGNGGSCSFRDAAGGSTIVDWCVPRFVNAGGRPHRRNHASSANNRPVSMASR